MAHPLILHQYDTSPYSEKIRKVFALKRLTWHAVEQPTIMPKPDLVPLTGGYRRIPVLQLGADVYCDTQLIVRVVERLHPTPSVYPAGNEGACHVWNLWADKVVFMPAVAVVFAEIGHMVPQAFIDDRSKLMPGRDFADVPRQGPHAREQLRAMLAILDTQLADGRPWLLGTEASLADAACWNPIWFLRVAPDAQALVAAHPHVSAWSERMAALGDGDRRDLTPADALALARESTPAAPEGVAPGEPNGLQAGDAVRVTPDDYGFDPVAGELLTASIHEIAVRRTDPTLGEIVVHFPRIGFRVGRG
jgi:glutathione S-transferase